MGLERPKKKFQLWKKATAHFALCFVMGFFTGFAPTGKPSFFSKPGVVVPLNNSHISLPPRREISTSESGSNVVNRSSITESPLMQVPTMSKQPKEQEGSPEEGFVDGPKLSPGRLVIIVTPTSSREKHQGLLLRRLANTIKLVPPPLLWIVVEGQSGSDEFSEILRKTGIMYRHLVFKENFTDAEAELDHQRNVALRHIEHHKLSGIVHFAELSNVYDLGFFDELREIEGFGTWPMAVLSPNKNKVIIEGPVCDSSQVIGWHLKRMNNETETTRPPIHISSFAFNSSILWDPERWGRSSSIQHTSQNSVKFVKQVALEDETKLKGIPPEDCSKIMLWRLQFPVDNGNQAYDNPSNHHSG